MFGEQRWKIKLIVSTPLKCHSINILKLTIGANTNFTKMKSRKILSVLRIILSIFRLNHASNDRKNDWERRRFVQNISQKALLWF